eukprot:CAMPEP_0178522140 /NCGR_PEP_ID=MMETSP0696-20121128/28371_1 /TAXON_ID=265572 /ORGANISM="Extubocellulus spinifer, Strain CCMP396" /LENGTH=642 /DNA_ID=CAMNT_0020153229 /DNA_START=165 /DNA_END=2091 /DNA_ORIENTATION=+
MNSSSSDDEDYARSAAFDTTASASSSAVGKKAPRPRPPRPRPAPAPAAASSLTNAGSNEIVVLDDDSSSSSSSDSCDFGGDASSPAGFSSSSNAKPQQAAAAAARPSRPPAPPAAAASYSNDRNASRNNRTNYGGSFSSDDDSSSDDDPDGLLSSGPIFASSSASRHSVAAAAAGNSKSGGVRKRTAEERAAEAAAKKAKKAREVEGRKRAREAERAAKTRKKEEERTIRARRVLEDRQASGKFAAEEICALVDGDLARAGAGAGFGEAVGGSNASRSRDGGAVAAAAVTEGLGPMLLAALREKKHRVVVEGDTSLSTRIGESNVDDVAPVRWDGPPVGRGVGCVRWIRRDHVDGGSAGVAAAPSNDEAVQRTDMVAIVFHEPGAFLKLLERAASAEARDDYPELRAWLGRVRTSLASRWEQRWKCDPEVVGGKRGKKPATGGSSNWTESNSGGNGIASSSSRLVLVLHRVQAELQRQWNNGGRRRQSFAPTSEEELNDATVWLLMEENVECTLTSCDDETVDYLVNMTRALSEAPYYEDVTELHCVKKLKADASATSVVEKAQCAWMRMARQVPGMSEAKARKLVEHFPTLMSLVEKYEDPNLTLDEKKRLLDDCLVEGRKSKKLSDSFYRLMTSNDPNEL